MYDMYFSCPFWKILQKNNLGLRCKKDKGATNLRLVDKNTNADLFINQEELFLLEGSRVPLE